MKKVELLNLNGEKVKDFKLNENIFDITPNDKVLYDAIILARASLRQGTHKTKNRSEVSGGGRKPWRQKGTGRARQGSIRSPQWKGGGVVFAPKPRDYSFKMNKKEKRAALLSALTTKVLDNKLIVLDELKFDSIKTKNMVNVLTSLQVKKALIVMEDNNQNVVLSAKNIEGVKTAGVNTINVFDLLKYDTCVVTKAAAEKIQEVYA